MGFVHDKDDRIDRRIGAYPETSFTPRSMDYVLNPRPQSDKLAFPEYASKIERYRSFHDWPKSMKPTPTQLSDAGFFYTLRGDQVICFCCGGSLRDWETTDNPWIQHALWYGHCYFIRIMKGSEYIEAVRFNHSHHGMNDGPDLMIPPPPCQPIDHSKGTAMFPCGRSRQTNYANYVKVKCSHCGQHAFAYMKPSGFMG